MRPAVPDRNGCQPCSGTTQRCQHALFFCGGKLCKAACKAGTLDALLARLLAVTCITQGTVELQ